MENLEKLKNKNFLIVGSGFQLSIEKSYIRAFRKLGFKKLDYLFLDQGYLSILNKFNYSKISKTYYLICRIILINFLKKKKFHYIIIFKGIQFDLNTLEKSRKIQDSAKWINIYTDSHMAGICVLDIQGCKAQEYISYSSNFLGTCRAGNKLPWPYNLFDT